MWRTDYNRQWILNGSDVFHQNLPENQCIFIRGFRVERTLRLFSRIRAAAEPKPDPSGNDDELGTDGPSYTAETLERQAELMFLQRQEVWREVIQTFGLTCAM